MNKRQRKKAVMKEVSRFYDVVFERGRFRKDLAIVCGMDHRFRRTLSTVFIKETKTAYPMSHSGSKLPDYIEVTYNRDTQEMYFDWYSKQRQEILDLREVKK